MTWLVIAPFEIVFRAASIQQNGISLIGLVPSPAFDTVETTMPAAVGGADTGGGIAGLAKKFMLTGASSMLAEGATFPVDITKTRLQLQGQVRAAIHRETCLSQSARAPTHPHPPNGRPTSRAPG